MKTINLKIGENAYILIPETEVIVKCEIKDILSDLEFQRKMDDEKISEYLGKNFKGGPKKDTGVYPKNIDDNMYLVSYVINEENKEMWVRKDCIQKHPSNFLI